MEKAFIAASAAVLAIFAASCGKTVQAPEYTVNATPLQGTTGTMAYITMYENPDSIIDSVLVDNDSIVTFKGRIQAPILAKLTTNADPLILEPGVITMSAEGYPSGTPANDSLAAYMKLRRKCRTDFMQARQAGNDSLCNAIDSTYDASVQEIIASGGLTGLYALTSNSYLLTLAQLDSLTTRYPEYAASENVKFIRTRLENSEKTAPGKMFTDFKIEPSDSTLPAQRLSDYVGKGRYVLVDFWASWCGPCRAEMPVVREVYEQYGKKGLDVLGVAVWDDVANSQKAIEELKLPWPQILGAKNIPTEIYGIMGIPHIILFAPDGTIVARDLRGDGLRKAVADAMAPASPAISQ